MGLGCQHNICIMIAILHAYDKKITILLSLSDLLNDYAKAKGSQCSQQQLYYETKPREVFPVYLKFH